MSWLRSLFKYKSSPSVTFEDENEENDHKRRSVLEPLKESHNEDGVQAESVNGDNSSQSSVAEDPSETLPEPYIVDSKNVSIHLGHTEQLSLLSKRSFSHQFRSCNSLSSLLNDDHVGGESSQGYGTQDGRHGDDRSQSFMGSQPDWRVIFCRSDLSIPAAKDDIPTYEYTTPSETPAPVEESATGLDSGVQQSPTTLVTHIHGSHASVQINDYSPYLGTDCSRLSKSPSGPNLFSFHGSETSKWTSIASRAELQIAPFENENITVLTRAIKRCVENLTRKDGDHVAVVVGHDFDGKTFTAQSALARLSKTWELALIVKPDEVDDIQLSGGIRTCIFKDDIFDKHISNLDKWEERFDEILSKAQAWRVGVVFTINKRVFDKYVTEHKRHELFKEENIVDLTSAYKLSFAESIGMLRCHLQLRPDGQNVSFTEFKKKDNADTYEGNGILFIWVGYLKDIASQPCMFGFPKQSKEYSSDIKHIRMRSAFFNLPQHFHCLAVSNIRKSDEKADRNGSFALETTLVCRGKVYIDKLQEKFETLMKCHDISRDRLSRKSPKKISDGYSIILERLKTMKSPEMAVSCFIKGTDSLKNWLLKETDGTVCFASPAIHNATAVNISDDYEADVVKCAPLDFIHTCIRPNDDIDRNRDTCLRLFEHPSSSTVKDQVCQRLLTDVIKNGNVVDFCNHHMMTKRWFAVRFLEIVEKSDNQQKFVSTTDTRTGMTALFHGMNAQFVKTGKGDPHNFTEELVKKALWRRFCKNEQLKSGQERETLYRACKLGIYSTYRCLRKNPDIKCLELAVESGNDELSKDILRQLRSLEFSQICDVLAKACRIHCKTNPDAGKTIARLLISKGGSIDRKDHEHDPLIHDVVKENDVQLLNFLLELECSLDIKDRKGNHPLHTCVLSKSTECADVLLKRGADATQTNKQGLTPLHLSVKEGSYDIVQVLTRHKESLNRADLNGRSALHIVIKQKRSKDMMEGLISSGADVNQKDNENHGPLYYALMTGNINAVKLLLKSGGVFTEDDRCNTALFQEKIAQYPQLAEIMIEYSTQLGMDMEVPFLLIDCLSVGLFRKTLDRIGNTRSRNRQGDTLLKYAVDRDCITFVKLLCDIDQSLIRVTSNGMLPLHAAVAKSSIDVCKCLIAYGASLTSRTNRGDTILHLACNNGRMDVIEIVLEMEKDLINERNHDGKTALYMAVENGYVAIVQILLIMGADPGTQCRLPPFKPIDIALSKRNFYNARCGSKDIETVRIYDCIMAELRKYMFGRKGYVSTMELYRR